MEQTITWRYADEELPPIDVYVLIQLTKKYAGNENITIGMYFEDDGWYTGHILLDKEEPHHIVAWAYLPEPVKEK